MVCAVACVPNVTAKMGDARQVSSGLWPVRAAAHPDPGLRVAALCGGGGVGASPAHYYCVVVVLVGSDSLLCIAAGAPAMPD
jgi:hypothetical protein